MRDNHLSARPHQNLQKTPKKPQNLTFSHQTLTGSQIVKKRPLPSSLYGKIDDFGPDGGPRGGPPSHEPPKNTLNTPSPPTYR